MEKSKYCWLYNNYGNVIRCNVGLICPLLSHVKQRECVLRFTRISRFIFAMSTESIIIISEKSVCMPIGLHNVRFAVTTKACYAILNNIALTLKYQLFSSIFRYFSKWTFILFIVHHFKLHEYNLIVSWILGILYKNIELILTLHILQCNE